MSDDASPDPVDDERDEQIWSRGYSAALTGVLAKVLSDLGYQDTEATRSRWVIEREGAIRALRSICRMVGDNDWPDNLSLGDIIEKHLERHFDEGRKMDTMVRILDSFTPEQRVDAMQLYCSECGNSIYEEDLCTCEGE